MLIQDQVKIKIKIKIFPIFSFSLLVIVIVLSLILQKFVFLIVIYLYFYSSLYFFKQSLYVNYSLGLCLYILISNNSVIFLIIIILKPLFNVFLSRSFTKLYFYYWMLLNYLYMMTWNPITSPEHFLRFFLSLALITVKKKREWWGKENRVWPKVSLWKLPHLHNHFRLP